MVTTAAYVQADNSVLPTLLISISFVRSLSPARSAHEFEFTLLECPDFIWMVEALKDYFVHRSSPFARTVRRLDYQKRKRPRILSRPSKFMRSAFSGDLRHPHVRRHCGHHDRRGLHHGDHDDVRRHLHRHPDGHRRRADDLRRDRRHSRVEGHRRD